MYNKDLPNRTELPSTARLIRSTLIAALTAIVLLVTVVLPAEYAVDPTGVGRVLGLTEMGEIKQQLAKEALLEETSSEKFEEKSEPVPIDDTDQAQTSAEPEASVAPIIEPPIAADIWTDEMTMVLAPGEASEVKLFMGQDDVAIFEWIVEQGHLNSTLHGNGTDGEKVTYRNGRAETGQDGELKAQFDGRHGWFWRNRSDETVTLTLRVKGSYNQIKRVL